MTLVLLAQQPEGLVKCICKFFNYNNYSRLISESYNASLLYQNKIALNVVTVRAVSRFLVNSFSNSNVRIA